MPCLRIGPKDVDLLLKVTGKEFDPETMMYTLTLENGTIHDIPAMNEIEIGDTVKVFEDIFGVYNNNTSQVSVRSVMKRRNMPTRKRY